MLGHVAFTSMNSDLCHWVVDKAFEEDLNQTCHGNSALWRDLAAPSVMQKKKYNKLLICLHFLKANTF
jgi:hypothetical protein